jgi:hypothetical protein
MAEAPVPPSETLPDEPRSEKPAWRKWLSLAVKLVITVIIFWLIFTKLTKPEALWDHLVRSNPLWLVLAFGTFMLSKWVGAFRLNAYFRAMGLHLSAGYNWRLSLLGMYYNLFLPGGIGGDGYKVWFLSKTFGPRKRDLVWPLLLDRVSGLAVLVALLLGFLLLIPWADYLAHPNIGLRLDATWQGVGTALLVAGTPVMYALFYLAVRKLRRVFVQVFWQALGYSIALQLLQVLTAACIIWSLGAEPHLLEYLVLFLLSSIAHVLPITLSGAGSRELVFGVGAAAMGLSPDKAVFVGFAFYLVTVLSGLLGIYYSYRPERLNGPVPGRYEPVG